MLGPLCLVGTVRPNTSLPVGRCSREDASSGANGNPPNHIPVTSKHELCHARFEIPELHTVIRRPGEQPVSVRGECNRTDNAFVALESSDTLHFPCALSLNGPAEMPDLDSFVGAG